ncbi:MAG: hypothetical protein ABMA64_36895 [Myxococcota bacterium]
MRIRANVLRGLGDAGVRTWGHGGPIGALRIEDNRVEEVARTMLSWSDAVRAELLAVAPGIAGLATVTSAKGALERLLAHPNDSALPGLDAVLRWLERATLRGGIALSGVEDGEVRGNEIARVGVTALPPGFGAEEVHGPLIVIRPPEGGPGQVVTLPIVDRLQALSLAATVAVGQVQDLYGSLVAMRALATAYSAAAGADRTTVESRLYGPLAATVDALEGLGGGGRTLADELRGAGDEVRKAPDASTQTDKSHPLRATLAEAAAAAATDPRTATAWTTAARLDRALAKGGPAVAEEAAAIRKLGDTLTKGMDKLELGFDDVFAKLAGASDDPAVRMAAVGVLDRIGQAWADRVAWERGLVGTDLSAADRSLVSTLTDGLIKGVEKLVKARKVDPAQVAELANLTTGLADAVRKLNTNLALDLGTDFGQLVGAEGNLDPEAAIRLRTTLTRIRDLAKSGGLEVVVRGADLERLVAVYEEQLVRLTASALEGAVRDASVGGTARELDRLVVDAGQLLALIGEDKEKAPIAGLVVGSLEAARASKRPTVELGAARDHLVELQQALVPAPRTDLGSNGTAPASEVERIAALGQAILALRARRDTDQNTVGIGLFAEHVGNLLDLGGAGAFARTGSVARIQSAGAVLGRSASGEAADAAWFALAQELENAVLALAADTRAGPGRCGCRRPTPPRSVPMSWWRSPAPRSMCVGVIRPCWRRSSRCRWTAGAWSWW